MSTKWKLNTYNLTYVISASNILHVLFELNIFNGNKIY